MGGREHPLVGVVRECLANNPERRPTTSDLLSSLEEVGTETEGGLLQLDIARVKTVRSLEQCKGEEDTGTAGENKVLRCSCTKIIKTSVSAS